MKKIFAAVLAFGSFAAFAGAHNMAGCGLGSLVFKNNTKGHQILAATTNGTFGSQTFGITSGTLNCTENGVAKVEKKQEMFAEANYEVLSKEMAQGKGQTLTAFANVLGCEKSATSDFAKLCQNKYKSTFSKASNSNELLGLVQTEIQKDASLAKSCKSNG